MASSLGAYSLVHFTLIFPKGKGIYIMGGSPGELSEGFLTQEKRNIGSRMNCDVGEATEGLENEV